VKVMRFATGARAEIRRPGGVEQVVDVTFRNDAASPGAVGYEFETDGLALRLRLPSRETKGTLAEALLAAAEAATPRQVAADAVLADVASDEHDQGRVTIWLTETTLGGAGVLQAIGDRFATEPRIIFSGLEAALEPSDLEVAASALARTYRLAADDPAVAAAMAQSRSEFGHAARAQARENLFAELRRCGVEITRPFVVALNARLLAPGIRVEHDHVVRWLLDLWEAAEAFIGIELDPRELAVLAAEDQTAVDRAVAAGLFSAGAPAGDRALTLGALAKGLGLAPPNAIQLESVPAGVSE
jgi:hypothetical protein